MNKEQILILGIGNVLMGDEGVGVHAARQLERTHFPPHIRIIDGGTGGFHLLPLFDECDCIVMIDATMDGQPAGTVSVTEPRFASDFPRALSAHDIGLRDLVESASLLSSLPKTYLVTISIDEMRTMCMELSRKVSDSLSAVTDAVRTILERIGKSASGKISHAVSAGAEDPVSQKVTCEDAPPGPPLHGQDDRATWHGHPAQGRARRARPCPG